MQTYDPIEVEMGELISELLVMVWLPVGVIFDDVEHCGRDCALSYRLTDKIEVVALRTGHHCVDDSARHRVLELSFAHSLHETGINSFGDYNEREFDILSGSSDLFDGLFYLC